MKAIALALAAALATPALADDRGDQWLYRVIYDETPTPIAIFLDWTYSSVAFRARCDRQTRELVVEYFGDGVAILSDSDEMDVMVGDAILPMRTRLLERRLVGRVGARAFLDAYDADAEVAISAPTEMGEPWHTGRAEPLARVAKACA